MDKKHIKRNNVIKKIKGAEPPKSLFFLLLLLYILSYIYVLIASRSQNMVQIAGLSVPYSAFTGVFSSFANMCIIFMVVFFKRTGLITSLVIMSIQVPMIIVSVFVRHNPTGIPGLFTNLLTITAIFLIYHGNKTTEKYRNKEMEYLKQQQKLSHDLFDQTATALVNAIDAKDTYSHGHSMRVAEYAKKIASEMGKDELKCRQIYYTGLLHDVGKIGIPIRIINKKGKLTAAEYDVIKEHPVKGEQILSGITEYPYLAIGAHYHHERYDGKGYPFGLKGDDIPEIARIISVADAYDAMSSNRSYRQAIPQQLVREEIVKGAGTQFDPEMAKIMIHLIDLDTEYKMKELTSSSEQSEINEIVCTKSRSAYSEGFLINSFSSRIRLRVTCNKKEKNASGKVSMIIFDSLDGRMHNDEKTAQDMNYYEYCEVFFDGKYESRGVRRIKTEISENREAKYDDPYGEKDAATGDIYEIDAVRIKDHMQLRLCGKDKIITMTIALPDSTRYTYIAFTGEDLRISGINVDKAAAMAPSDYIPRIAEEISYIRDNQGDIPNVQMDDYRSDATEGIKLRDKLTVSFHSMSLPTARLIWHCAYIVLFYSDDGNVDGDNYREYALIRLDGENWEDEEISRNDLIVDKKADFAGWDNWKIKNKEGIDVTASIERKGDCVTVTTENLSIYLQNKTTVLDGTKDLYIALTGDQCAITNIHISDK